MWHRRLPTAVAVAMVAIVAMVGAAASAQQALGVDIQVADLEDDGTTEVVVAVSGVPAGAELGPDTFTVTEGGETIDAVTVTPVTEDVEREARTVIVVLDTSTSTRGEPIAAAQSAATDFAETVMADGVHVGIVTFAAEATLVQPPTDDVAAVTSAIDAVVAEGETALFDAVVVAARTLQNVTGTGSIVVFSDGGDLGSTATLEGAQNAASTVGATVSAVALVTSDLDLDQLRGLTDPSGGTLVQAANVDALGGAFEEVATALTNQYVLAYTSLQETGEFDLGVTLTLGDATATDQITVLSQRRSGGVGEPRVLAVSDPGIFGSTTGLYVALGGLFLGLLVLLGFMLVPTGDTRVTRTLERGMGMVRRDGAVRTSDSRAASSAIGRRTVAFVESVPKPAGYDERVQRALDRAQWPLRASEFTTLRVVAVLAGVLVGWGLFGNPLLGLVGGVAGWVLPLLVLGQRVVARRTKFLAQLPDTLQLLAGSLKAGYGILQGIDTIVKETSEPTSTEFRQVLTEARLGLPLEESLEGMAERIDSDDFRWVAVAINIQRRVGGNLAELLETVANTLREREMVRRQISALSAEGKLSAIILTVLPIGLAVYMAVVAPDYISVLFTESIGRLMVVGAALLMGAGALWMRRLIDIDV